VRAAFQDKVFPLILEQSARGRWSWKELSNDYIKKERNDHQATGTEAFWALITEEI
jgi:hypothetical protein